MKFKAILLSFVMMFSCSNSYSMNISLNVPNVTYDMGQEIAALFKVAFFAIDDSDDLFMSDRALERLNELLAQLDGVLTVRVNDPDFCNCDYCGEFILKRNICAPQRFWDWHRQQVIAALHCFTGPLHLPVPPTEAQLEILRVAEKKNEILNDPRSVCRNADEIALLKRIFEKEEAARRTSIVKWLGPIVKEKKYTGVSLIK